MAAGRGGRDGRRSGDGKVDDGGDEARGTGCKDPGSNLWMSEVDLL